MLTPPMSSSEDLPQEDRPRASAAVSANAVRIRRNPRLPKSDRRFIGASPVQLCKRMRPGRNNSKQFQNDLPAGSDPKRTGWRAVDRRLIRDGDKFVNKATTR